MASDRPRVVPPRPPVILIAEGHADSRDLCAEVLKAEGWLVITAIDGERALWAIDEMKPAVVVADAFLSVSDGGTLITAISRMKDPPKIVAITSGWSREPQADALEEARALGVDVVLRKAIDPPMLVQAVRDVLGDAAR